MVVTSNIEAAGVGCYSIKTAKRAARDLAPGEEQDRHVYELCMRGWHTLSLIGQDDGRPNVWHPLPYHERVYNQRS